MLAVVQTGGEAVEAEVWVAHEGGSGPFVGFGGVVGFDVAVDWRGSGFWSWKRGERG